MDPMYFDALEQQIATLHYLETKAGSLLAQSLLVHEPLLRPSAALGLPMEPSDGVGHLEADHILRLLMDPLRRGAPYYWDQGLCSLLETLAPEVPLDWSMTIDLLPTAAGYLRFARPLHLPLWNDVEREDLIAISWSLLGWGRDPQEALRGWPAEFTDVQGEQMANVSIVFHTSDETRPSGNPVTIAPWGFRVSLGTVIEAGEAELMTGTQGEIAANDLERWRLKLRYWSAALAFMNSKCAASTKAIVPRSARKRAERANWQHEPSVRVIELRRRERRPGDPESFVEVEWTCRWMVRPHFRQQWYPSTGEHRQIIVPGHIRGPEGLPLKPPGQKLFAVIR